MTTSTPDDWATNVADFWCRELTPKQWFAKNEALDALIKERFGAVHESLASRAPGDFLSSPAQSFAAIILFDQLSRNLFRGDARSFASDPLARAIASGMIDKGWDEETQRDYRVFIYLPFEHSESLADQDRSIALISALGDQEFTRYAYAHRDVIARFGRFPHRNAILGRPSTPEEEAFLAQPGSRF